MSTTRPFRLLLDLGSRSAKAYRKENSWIEDRQMTWSLLERDCGPAEIMRDLKNLLGHYPADTRVSAIGTEAMRRHPHLAQIVTESCHALGIQYRTLSQKEEAQLIHKAFPNQHGFDLINVGGGSIQIVSSQNVDLHLLPFGISDLNKQFLLTANPADRQIETCIVWIENRLPMLSPSFVYTGGEEKYLRHLGVNISAGACSKKDFHDLAEKLAPLSIPELESLSPHDPKWMHGAIASNCIVIACLRKSKAEAFFPSDLNIAHGLIDAVSLGA